MTLLSVAYSLGTFIVDVGRVYKWQFVRR
jgi:hypothetical protein